MNNLIKDFVEQQVLKTLPPVQREKFLEIARFCDSIGHDALSMSADELGAEYMMQNLQQTLLVKTDVQKFLDNDLITTYFTKTLVKTKNVDLRKMIANLDKKGLDQKSIKALEMLQAFMQESADSNGVVYITYHTPTRYCEEDTLKFVENMIEEEINGSK